MVSITDIRQTVTGKAKFSLFLFHYVPNHEGISKYY